MIIIYSRSKESQHGTGEGGTTMMPPGAKPIPPPKPKKATNDNTGRHPSALCNKYTYYIHTPTPPPPYTHPYVQYTDNKCFFPTGLPTEEGENIYDQPNTGVECSSPPPTETEYYNQSAIFLHHQSQYGTQANAIIPMPPSTARARPTPLPKPKKHTEYTGTQRSINQHCCD